MAYGAENLHGLKTSPSTQFGTPELEFLVVIINDSEANTFNAEGEYVDSDSAYSKAVRGLQVVGDVYAVFEPGTDRFTAIVRSGTLPRDAGESAGDGNSNSVVGAAVSAATGFACTVWSAELVGSNLNFD